MPTNQKTITTNERPRDDVPTMMGKLLARINSIAGEIHKEQKDMMWAEAQEYEKKNDLDSLITLYKRIGGYIRNLPAIEAELKRVEAEQAEKAAKRVEAAQEKAEEVKKFKEATAPVMEAWEEAKLAYALGVKAENAKGHKGQAAYDAEFFNKFLSLWLRIEKMRVEDASKLIEDIVAQTDEVRYFEQNWCQHESCGLAIPAQIIPKSGGKAFKPKFCQSHVPVKQDQLGSKKTPFVSSDLWAPKTVRQKNVALNSPDSTLSPEAKAKLKVAKKKGGRKEMEEKKAAQRAARDTQFRSPAPTTAVDPFEADQEAARKLEEERLAAELKAKEEAAELAKATAEAKGRTAAAAATPTGKAPKARKSGKAIKGGQAPAEGTQPEAKKVTRRKGGK